MFRFLSDVLICVQEGRMADRTVQRSRPLLTNFQSKTNPRLGYNHEKKGINITTYMWRVVLQGLKTDRTHIWGVLTNCEPASHASHHVSHARQMLVLFPVVTTENNIRRELLKDFDLSARRMRLQYIYYGKEREPHPFHVKSDWNPPVQPSVALETFLEVKLELAEIKFKKPKPNLAPGELQALKQLSRDKAIVLCHDEQRK